MLDFDNMQNYVGWRVAQVIPVRGGFGYRIFLKYPDGSEKPQQKSGFKTQKEANKARDKTIAELYNGTFVVYGKVKVSEFMTFWLERDLKQRTKSHETYYNYCGVVKNHIIPILGRKYMTDVSRGDVQKLFNAKASYSRSVAEQVKTIMNVSFRYAVTMKVIDENPVSGLRLPRMEKRPQGAGYHTRNIDAQKTLTLDQVHVLLEKSKDTPIYMQVLFNVLMGLRRSEIIGLKYSDVDYINRTLKVERQLGKVHKSSKNDFAPKTFTKQEIGLKTESSYRELPIPDVVYEAILAERQRYEKNRSRRINDITTPFYDGDYICCSTYGKPRSKGFHLKYYKQILEENNLPDIRWHDLRSTYCTLLLKASFNPKAVSKLMGHSKEIITMNVYGDNQNIIDDGVPEIESFINDVLPDAEQMDELKKELLENVIDVSVYI